MTIEAIPTGIFPYSADTFLAIRSALDLKLQIVKNDREILRLGSLAVAQIKNPEVALELLDLSADLASL